MQTNSDETVEVGAPLYEVDTDATASSVASGDADGGTSSDGTAEKTDSKAAESPKEEAPDAEETTKDQSTSATTTTSSSSTPTKKQQHRTPRIQFLGKEGWAERLNPQPVEELPPIHPMYGRPAFSEEEMEAFMLGGAEQAPKVVVHSSGAKFAY